MRQTDTCMSYRPLVAGVSPKDHKPRLKFQPCWVNVGIYWELNHVSCISVYNYRLIDKCVISEECSRPVAHHMTQYPLSSSRVPRRWRPPTCGLKLGWTSQVFVWYSPYFYLPLWDDSEGLSEVETGGLGEWGWVGVGDGRSNPLIGASIYLGAKSPADKASRRNCFPVGAANKSHARQNWSGAIRGALIMHYISLLPAQ